MGNFLPPSISCKNINDSKIISKNSKCKFGELFWLHSLPYINTIQNMDSIDFIWKITSIVVSCLQTVNTLMPVIQGEYTLSDLFNLMEVITIIMTRRMINAWPQCDTFVFQIRIHAWMNLTSWFKYWGHVFSHWFLSFFLGCVFISKTQWLNAVGCSGRGVDLKAVSWSGRWGCYYCSN